MVVTSLTRNQVVHPGTWVRIPPSPLELSPEKAQSTKTLEISRVFAIFTVNFVAKTQGTKLAVFLIPPDSNRRKL